MKKRKAWIRVAGHATNIKSNHVHSWRCYIGGSPTEIPLKDWSVSGMASQKNFIPGVSATRDEHGLVAWVDCFGSYVIEREILYIDLQEPMPQNAQQ